MSGLLGGCYIQVLDNDIRLNNWDTRNATQQFKSIESIYNDIHTKLGEFEDEADFFAFIGANKKFIELKDRPDGDQEVLNKTDVTENRFANEDFIFMIDDSVIDVRDIEQMFEDFLLKTSGGEEKEIEVEEINNNNGCKNDRKGKLRVRAQRGVDPNNNTSNRPCLAQIGIKLSGQTKRFCVWVNYKTALNYVGDQVASAVFKALNPSVPFYYTSIHAPSTPWLGFTSCANCFSIERFTSITGSNPPVVDCSGEYYLIPTVRVIGTTQGLDGMNIIASCL